MAGTMLGAGEYVFQWFTADPDLIYNMKPILKILGILLGTIIWMNYSTKKREIDRIIKIYDPDEKIAALEKYMQKNAALGKANNALNKEKAHLKMNLNCWIALAYMDKGDYKTAYNVFENILPLLMKTESQKNDECLQIEDYHLLGVVSCLANLGRTDDAKRTIKPLLEKNFPDRLSNCIVQLYNAELAIMQQDNVEGRQILTRIAPEIVIFAKQFNNMDFYYGLLLLEAMTDKKKKKKKEAVSKFKEILQNCKNYGNLRRAQQELNTLDNNAN
jgi:tetratricopeptide (TPR) repeat protein